MGTSSNRIVDDFKEQTMKHEPIGDHAERKRIFALIERCEKEQMMSDRLLKESDVLDAILGWETDPLDEELERAVKAIPSADRPQGEWVDRCLEYEDYECSECGYITEPFGGKYLYNYCPWCGAYMKGADDE